MNKENFELHKQAIRLRKMPKEELEALTYMVDEYHEWKRLKELEGLR